MIEDLFYVKKGRGGYIENYAIGTTPLVSATTSNNGIVALVKDIPRFKAPAITVERVMGTAFVQIIDFSTVPDDVSVLIPINPMRIKQMYAIASIITNSKWRFSFARKLTPTRLKKMRIPNGDYTNINLVNLQSILPKKIQANKAKTETGQHAYISLSSLVTLHSGDYHKAASLKKGRIPLVSCGDRENGIIGHYQVPEDKRYRFTITVAYNGQPLTTKFHPYEFAAKDDVAVCIPKRKFRLSTLIFLQYVLNREQWRYSYGRKCFREKLSQFRLQLPVKSDGTVDEEAIERIVANTEYWNYFKTETQEMEQKLEATKINFFQHSSTDK